MISVKVIADSISKHTGQRIATLELEYPRFIHAELMTHRVFSRNSSSSRAIPILAMIKHVENNTAKPIHWGKNQSGMQAREELSQVGINYCESIWESAMRSAVEHVQNLAGYGLHKQIANRILEPFQMIKVIVTATAFDNWFNLRMHADAQPEIHELAKLMYEALALSEPMELNHGEWHLPYIERERDEEGKLHYFIYEELYHPIQVQLTLEQAQKISCSCCAQVSYRKSDTSLAKSEAIYDKLVNSEPVHASAFEHCATPISYNVSIGGNVFNFPHRFGSWQEGITHVNKKSELCSGNFTNWIQYRQLIPSNVCEHYELGEL